MTQDWTEDDDLDPDSVDYDDNSSDEAPSTAAGLEADDSKEDEPELVYPNVHEWVRLWLRFAYKRKIDGTQRRWWAKWWQIDEALMRLEALWRAWEHLRLDPGTGMSVWWRDHADHHLAALMDTDGPFHGIDGIDSPESTSKAQEPLPHIDAPDWLFERSDETPHD